MLVTTASHFSYRTSIWRKTFDWAGHLTIIQALHAFGVPEIMIQAIHQYSLVGLAYVEVNG
jgi:saccharopine dehydrogenase-like NADP-dependent oxidoreductase